MENNNKNTKDAVLFIKVSHEEKAELQEVVARQPGDLTVSRFVRDAFREKIAALKETAAEPATASAS